MFEAFVEYHLHLWVSAKGVAFPSEQPIDYTRIFGMWRIHFT